MLVGIGALFAGIFLFFVMKWWSEGIYETSDAFLLAVVFCGLIFGLFASQELWQRVLALVPLLAAAGFTYYSYRLGSWQHLYKQRCEQYMKAVAHDPRNHGAREQLANALYQLGKLDEAIDELQMAVDMGAGIECQHKLSKWQRERHLKETTNPVCRLCATEHAPGTRICSRCGVELPYSSTFSRWLTGGNSAKSRYWLLVLFGVFIISVSIVFLPLELAAIPIILFCLALVGWALISSSRS